MSADKRSVSTDALETLGTLIGPGEKRDAIHLAVEPMVAGERLRPGEHVIVENGLAFEVPVGAGLGIVDPFLTTSVKKGERFWFVLYPRQVRSLRHVWSHPSFPDEPVVGVAPVGQVADINPEADSDRVKALFWMKIYAQETGTTFDELMRFAEAWIDGGEYTSHGPRFEGVSTPNEFWVHYKVLTGRDGEGNFFSCSC